MHNFVFASSCTSSKFIAILNIVSTTIGDSGIANDANFGLIGKLCELFNPFIIFLFGEGLHISGGIFVLKFACFIFYGL